jgi:hypothetical protein
MYERVNINCAEVNSTWVSGGGIYFFNFQLRDKFYFWLAESNILV